MITTRCVTCHSSTLTGAARNGADVGVDFDTEAGITRWSDRIRVRAIDAKTMPPGAPLADCQTQQLSDYLDTLVASCVPSCSARVCGDDGCGGVCGACSGAEVCSSVGTCDPPPCVPDCTGRACGDDGCGGSCGTCGSGTTCDATSHCVCAPNCSGKQCGNDGCGGSCGTCNGVLICNANVGTCGATCTPDCTGRVCGDDGCGGSCGVCDGGACLSTGVCGCAPSCSGKQCGDDGCGGSCGSCSAGATCSTAGACAVPPTSYAADVQPIFNAYSCGGSMCHGGARPAEGLVLSSATSGYAGLVNVSSTECTSKVRVKPGDTTASYLINKLTGSGMCTGSRMPKMGTGLTTAELNTVRAWILGGAAP